MANSFFVWLALDVVVFMITVGHCCKFAEKTSLVMTPRNISPRTYTISYENKYIYHRVLLMQREIIKSLITPPFPSR